MQHLASSPLRGENVSAFFCRILARVRFLAYHRIKPHAPPLVRTPVNSFEFHRCRRTPQVGYLSLSLGHPGLPPDAEYPSFTVRTTRVSNPVRSPHFRASASYPWQQAAFASGIPCGIYAFHRYTANSACPPWHQAEQYQGQPRG
jgi:hypothetical protein